MQYPKSFLQGPWRMMPKQTLGALWPGQCCLNRFTSCSFGGIIYSSVWASWKNAGIYERWHGYGMQCNVSFFLSFCANLAIKKVCTAYLFQYFINCFCHQTKLNSGYWIWDIAKRKVSRYLLQVWKYVDTALQYCFKFWIHLFSQFETFLFFHFLTLCVYSHLAEFIWTSVHY